MLRSPGPGIRKSPWREKALLQSVPGLGPSSSTTLLAYLPDWIWIRGNRCSGSVDF